jgi:ubiquinone/menaquinone biosynthesis C-methylase UbiE
VSDAGQVSDAGEVRSTSLEPHSSLDWSTIPLACPTCGAAIRPLDDALRCDNRHTFPIVDGIPRFVRSGSYAEPFGFEWKRHARTQVDARGRSREAMLQKTGLTPPELVGRLVLDVGVGAGRYAVVAADAGARVVGVDMTEAAEVAAQNLEGRGFVAQADRFSLPLRPASFDVVYSIGVLHHTPSTKAAVEEIARFVAPGGILAVWVYFPSRSKLFSDLYRHITTRLDAPTLYRLAKLASRRLYRLGRLPIIGRVIGFVVPISHEPDPEWRALDTFDWYAPRYQWKHRPEEVEAWFRELGFEDVRALPFVTGIRGRRPIEVGDQPPAARG